MFSVLDGHGVDGHLVAQYLSKELQIQIAKEA